MEWKAFMESIQNLDLKFCAEQLLLYFMYVIKMNSKGLYVRKNKIISNISGQSGGDL